MSLKYGTLQFCRAFLEIWFSVPSTRGNEESRGRTSGYLRCRGNYYTGRGFIPHTNISTFIQGVKKSTDASIVYEPPTAFQSTTLRNNFFVASKNRPKACTRKRTEGMKPPCESKTFCTLSRARQNSEVCWFCKVWMLCGFNTHTMFIYKIFRTPRSVAPGACRRY